MNRAGIIAILSIFLISFFSGSITGMVPVKGYVILYDDTPVGKLEPLTVLHLRNQGIKVWEGKLNVPGVGVQRVPFPTYEQARVLPDLIRLSGNENLSQVQMALEKRSEFIKQRSMDTAKLLNAEDSKCGGEYVISATDYGVVSRGAAISRTKYRIDSCRKQRYGSRTSSYPFGDIRDDPETKASENMNITKNCGTDFTCLILAGKTCEPAKVTRTLKKNVVGYDHTLTTYYELSSSNKDYCTLYFSTQEIKITMSAAFVDESRAANMTTEEMQTNLDAQQDNADKQEGKDALCRIAIVDLEDILKKVKADTIKLSDWKDEDCEGDFFK